MCGFRPTGQLHIGHYFSVIKPGQNNDTDVLIANYHAVNETVNIELLHKFNVKNIKYQKDVFNPELYFRLLNLSSIGELQRMTQFKFYENKTAHLLTYPVLMSHDIAGYKEVLVGEDQKQHLEFGTKLLKKYNKAYQPYCIPKPNIVVGRIKDLIDPTKKMSKSSPKGCLFLTDTPEEIKLKIRKANTNSEGIENLSFLFKEFVGTEIPSSNSTLKDILSEKIIERFNDI